MFELLQRTLAAQLEAALCHFNRCLVDCPDEHWDGLIANYPYWQVAYHTLCFVDLYLSPQDDAWQPRIGAGGLHPLGRRELEEEYPSRRFEKRELLDYVTICRQKLREALAAETPESLAGPSGFARLPFSRLELHLYDLRHVQHHAGQLSAFLHRLGHSSRWVSSGWK